MLQEKKVGNYFMNYQNLDDEIPPEKWMFNSLYIQSKNK